MPLKNVLDQFDNLPKWVRDIGNIYNAGIESVRDYINKEPVKRSAPKVRLVISPFFLPAPLELYGLEAGGLIQSAIFEKSRSSAYGTFSVAIVPDYPKLYAEMRRRNLPTRGPLGEFQIEDL